MPGTEGGCPQRSNGLQSLLTPAESASRNVVGHLAKRGNAAVALALVNGIEPANVKNQQFVGHFRQLTPLRY